MPVTFIVPTEKQRAIWEAVGHVDGWEKTEPPPGWNSHGSQRFCDKPDRPGFATFDQAWAEYEYEESLVEVEVFVCP